MPIATELAINTAATALDMANAIFGNGVVVQSATYQGATLSSGIYTGALSTIAGISPTDSGVILSTGNVVDFTNSSGTTNTNVATNTGIDVAGGIDGDAQLNAVAGVNTFDGSILNVNFIPDGDYLTIQFVFSSEEYPEYVNGNINDAFGVWINGNFVPVSVTTAGNVAIDTVNGTANENLYIDNTADQYNTEMDGFTRVLSFKAPVISGQVNTIKIGIADGADAIYDSNLLIMADSGQTITLAMDDNVHVQTNSTRTFDILANDTTKSGAALTITQINGTNVVAGQTVTLISGQQVRLNADGTITVTANGTNGAENFSYTVSDGVNTDIGYVTITTAATVSRDGIVSGTSGNDVIDTSYLGDPDGDRIDNNDATGVQGTTGNSDLIYAGAGNDSIVAGQGNDIIYGGTGNDTAFGGVGNDTLYGDAGADSLYGDAGNDSIYGGAGNDVIAGDAGNDRMDGGDGADLFALGTGFGVDTIVGGEGGLDYDTISSLSNSSAVTITYTGTEAGTITDASGNSATFSQIEAQVLSLGNDVVNAANDTVGVNISDFGGDDTITGGSGTDTIDAGAGNDSVNGGAGNDSIYGGDGRDVLIGGLGADSLFGGADADTIYGGAGDVIDGGETTTAGGTDNDVLVVEAGSVVTYGGGNNEAGTIALASGGTLTFSNIENIVFAGPVDGTAGDDVMNPGYTDLNGDQIDGTDGLNDTIYGYGGNDSITAGDGNDWVYGGVGDDTINTGIGTDVVYGGLGNDSIVGGGSETGNNSDALFGDEGNDTITGSLTGNTLAYGGTGDDSIIGGNLQDQLIGDEGNDSIFGGGGNDVLDGDAGNDSIDGGTGNDTISGGDGRDVLIGGLGDDSLFGGADADTIYGGAGDVIDGGETTTAGGTDNDVLVVEAGSVVTYGGGNNEAGTIALASGGTLTFSNIENIVFAGPVDGTAGDDVMNPGYTDLNGDQIDGTDGLNDTIYGYGGNDSITAGAGNDTIYAGSENDTVHGSIGNDLIFGDAGNDSLLGDAGDDSLYGGTGNDTLTYAAGNDQLFGGDGSDLFVINDATGNVSIQGGETDDTAPGDWLLLTGAAAKTVVFSTDETGTLSGGGLTGNFSEIEMLTTGAGNDLVDATATTLGTVLNTGDGSDTLIGGSGNDLLYAGAGDDTVFGNAGQDTIWAGAGNDNIDGGDGNDNLSGEAGSDSLFGGLGNDTLDGGDGNDSLYGGAGADVLYAGAGLFNLFDGGDGNDSMYGGAGNDTYYGGAGDDFVLDGGFDNYVDMGAGNDTVLTDFGNDTIFGGDGNDSISSGAGNDVIDAGIGNDYVYAGDGNDLIDGLAGDDLIYGGTGDDTVNGWDDNDTLYGGAGNDIVDGDAGNDFVFGDAGDDTLMGDAGNDWLGGGDGNDQLYGGADDDTLTGDAGNDWLGGGDGNDQLDGGAGTDTLFGDAGNDVLAGGDGNDQLYGGVGDDTISGDQGDDYVEAYLGNDSVAGGLGNDTIDGGDGNDTLLGQDGNDFLLGGAGDDNLDGGIGNDTLWSGDGNDTLIGGTGDDVMIGEGGDDTFVIADGFGNDTIQGSENGEVLGDTLNLSAVTTALTLDLTSGDAEAGTVSDGTSTLQFQQIENIVLGAGIDTLQLATGSGADSVAGFSAPIDNGDGTFTGVDQIDVGNLLNAQGGGVHAGDVSVGNDGFGNAVLTFPSGESLTLIGVSPAALASPLALAAMGIPLGDGIVSGTAGADLIDASYAGDPDGDHVDANDAILPGTSGNDDVIEAGAGDDTVYAGAGNDTVWGGDGNDVLFGDTGNDSLLGEAGDDTLIGGAGNDLLDGGADNDTFLFQGALANDTVIGGETGSDFDTLDLSGQTAAVNVLLNANEAGTVTDGGTASLAFSQIEAFSLTAQNDVFNAAATSADVTLDAGAGDDTILSGAGNDTLTAGAGNDLIYAGAGDDEVDAGDGNDSIYAGAGTDYLYGGAGADTFYLQNPMDNNIVYGGEAGIDSDEINLLGYTGEGIHLTFTGAETGLITGTTGGSTIFTQVENFNLTNQADYVDASAETSGVWIAGNLGNDTILGGSGDDVLIGNDGDDKFVMLNGFGSDFIHGGDTGETLGDTLDMSNVMGPLTWDLSNIDPEFGSVSNAGNSVSYVYVENLVLGMGRDTLVLADGSGADVVQNFTAPVDNLDGTFTGVDMLDVSGLHDLDATPVTVDDVTVSDDGNGNAVLSFPNGETLTLIGVDPAALNSPAALHAIGIPYAPDLIVDGTMGDDTMSVGFVDIHGDIIDGADGLNDTIYGYGGNDYIEAGDGNDLVYGGADNDQILGGIGDDTIDGGTGNDLLDGEDGNDLLVGNLGDDTLQGNGGNDTLIGGDGADLLLGENDRDVIFGGIGDTVDGGEGGDDYDVLDLTAFGPTATHVIYDPLNHENGTVEFLDGLGAVVGTLAFSNIEKVIACFTPGTMILTDAGAVAVETLQVGDLVLTRDTGLQPIRWIGRRDLSADDLAQEPRFNPVKIAAGALGQNQPERDMLVSPQHRMLIADASAELLFGEYEVLVPAVHLAGLAGVTRVAPQGVSYIHFMFDQHEILLADGAWSESFQPGAQTLNGLEAAQREEIFDLFPELAGREGYPAARMSLKAREARVLLAA